MTIDTITIIIKLLTTILLGISCGLYWHMNHTLLAWAMFFAAGLTAGSLLLMVI